MSAEHAKGQLYFRKKTLTHTSKKQLLQFFFLGSFFSTLGAPMFKEEPRKPAAMRARYRLNCRGHYVHFCSQNPTRGYPEDDSARRMYVLSYLNMMVWRSPGTSKLPCILYIHIHNPREAKGTQRNPVEPKGSQRNPKEPKGTQRNPKEPKGTQRNPKEPKEIQRGPEEPKGPQRNLKDHKGIYRNTKEPQGSQKEPKAPKVSYPITISSPHPLSDLHMH
jgi:hypothetical protein